MIENEIHEIIAKLNQRTSNSEVSVVARYYINRAITELRRVVEVLDDSAQVKEIELYMVKAGEFDFWERFEGEREYIDTQNFVLVTDEDKIIESVNPEFAHLIIERKAEFDIKYNKTHSVYLIPNNTETQGDLIIRELSGNANESNVIGYVSNWLYDDFSIIIFKIRGKFGVLSEGEVIIEPIYEKIRIEESYSEESDMLILFSGNTKRTFSIEENRIVE